jgi:peptidoglycan/xylan/chitin deacetylase (PgdA/CDA1 family)
VLQLLRRRSISLVRKLFALATRSILGTVTYVVTRDPVVALTFDDGPHPDYTPRLLEILAKYHARATFFMTGQAAQAHPELVRRVAEAGHAIANHSWDHPSFPLISSRERRAQIRACAQVLAPYTRGMRLFRPPYGEQNIASRIDALLLGYQVILLNVATDDWCGGKAISIANQLEQQIRPGSIIALHDRLFDALQETYFNREPVLEAVRILFDRLKGRYRFITVPELLRSGRPQKELWYKQVDVELLNNLRREAGPGRRYVQTGRSSWLTSLLVGESR